MDTASMSGNWVRIADLARARAQASLQAWELGQSRAHAPDAPPPAPRDPSAAAFAAEMATARLVNPV